MKIDPFALVRRPLNPGLADTLRSAIGALVALLLIAGVAWFLGPHLAHPELLLVPSIGSSAVLVFAIPASPLAQPRAVIGGNLLSAAIGVSCGLWIASPAIAAAVAVALAVIAMLMLGCLHPPGGGLAMGGALSAAATGASYPDTLLPIALCSVLLVAVAAVFINLTGRRYPHRAPAKVGVHATRDAAPADRVGFTTADLDKALAHYGQLLDVSRDDLDALFRQVELQAHQRIHSQILCQDIMSRDIISVDVHQSAESALAYLGGHDLRTAPVLDEAGHVVGMVRRAELQAGRGKAVAQVLDPFVHKVKPRTPIDRLLPLLSSGLAHEVMVVDDQRILVGVITQTDLLAVLYRAHIVEAVAAA